MRRFIPEIYGVDCGSCEKSGQEFAVFAPQIWEGPSECFWGHFVNRYHFRSTGQV